MATLREFDISRHLDSEKAIAVYLDEVMREEPGMLASALGDIARSRGMTDLARETGLARESLYQALSENGDLFDAQESPRRVRGSPQRRASNGVRCCLS